MKTRIVFSGALLILLLFAIAVPVRAQSPSPQQALDQYVADLQKNPNDSALREKIIKLAREMNPPPAIPEEARRHYVKACTLFDDAKQPSDSADAADEFRQALLVAPWWGDAYMKMGMALETAQRYDDAIASLKLFMATKPQGEVLRKTQDEIYKIEAKAEKAAKDAAKAREESSPQAIAAKKQNEFDDLLRKIDGRRFTHNNDDGGILVIDVKGKVFVVGVINPYKPGYWPGYHDQVHYEIRGRETTIQGYDPPSVYHIYVLSDTYKISEAGDTITLRRLLSDGTAVGLSYNWQQ